MNCRILNLTHEGLIKYTFTMTFPHCLSNGEFLERCIIPAIDEFQGRHRDRISRRPEVYLEAVAGESEHIGSGYSSQGGGENPLYPTAGVRGDDSQPLGLDEEVNVDGILKARSYEVKING